MREIKFRAWIENQKYMAVQGTPDLETLQSFMFHYGDEKFLMQYTGLKDKNGKEIYEGDYDKDYQVVRWCDNRNGWAMSIYDFPTKEFIACHCYNCEGNYELCEVLSEIEIIGNIYETPN